MASYRLTNKAVTDLSGIWNYTCSNWSEKQADKYYFMLLNTCEKLAKKPSLGRKYDNVYPDLLGYKADQHIIFYTAGKEQLTIVRILHSKMDLKSRLGD